MAIVNDRRGETREKFQSSRDKFLDRNRRKIREAIERKITNTGIKDLGKGGGVDVTVPKRDIHEPRIRHGQGGKSHGVLPGNKDFKKGDTLPKPEGQGGGGGNGDPSGDPFDGEDSFSFILSEEEFLDILYEDLQLPNLTKQAAEGVDKTKQKRAGFVTSGSPNKLDLPRSKISQLSRHAAFKKPQDRKIVEALREQRGILRPYDPDYTAEAFDKADELQDKLPMAKRKKALEEQVGTLKGKFLPCLTEEDRAALESLDQIIQNAEKKKSLVPLWNESTDLRYRHHEKQPVPNAQAVMFCLMDVSGSMGEEEKNNAKLFYWLLYKFLERNYDHVDIVFIRHTTDAEEVDEETFFFDRKSGGTVVSSALEKTKEIMAERYPVEDWNIYAAQATDGENFNFDNQACDRLLRELLPSMQGYFYTEISGSFFDDWAEEYWKVCEKVQAAFPEKMFMGKIRERQDIYPVFRDFFQKRETPGAAPGNSGAVAYMAPPSYP